MSRKDADLWFVDILKPRNAKDCYQKERDMEQIFPSVHPNEPALL
jgi:hypothetical protein